MRLSTLASLAAASLLALSGCSFVESITDSDGGPGPSVQHATASQKKVDRGAAGRGKVNSQALEKSKAKGKEKAADQNARAQESSRQESAASQPSPAAGIAKPASPALDADEEAALKNTEVSDADLSSEEKAGAKDADGGKKEGMDESAPSALPPVDEETARQISDLPDYATASGRQTCPASLGSSAQSAAAELAKVLSGKLNIDKGAVFCAPTVIPDEYSDCISDVSATVASGLAASGKFDMADSGRVQVAQNSGSSMLIPAYVRECRRNSIPYLAVTVVRKIGGKVSLTLRILRADTGVTLTQSYRRL